MNISVNHQDGYQVLVSIDLVPPITLSMQQDIRRSFSFDWIKHAQDHRYEVYGMWMESGELIGLMGLRLREDTYHIEYLAKRGSYKNRVRTVPVQITEGFLYFAAMKAKKKDPEDPAFVIAPKGGNKSLFSLYEGILKKAIAPKQEAITAIEAEGHTVLTYSRGYQRLVQDDIDQDLSREVIYVYATCVLALNRLY